MRKLISGMLVAAALAVASPASAVDLFNPRTYASAGYNWTGCHAGGSVGYASARTASNTSYTSSSIYGYSYQSPQIDYSNSGGLAWGGQVGCDYQFNSNWVVGLGLDATFFGKALENTHTESYNYYPGYNSTTTDTFRLDRMVSANARVGYSFGRFMPYITGGMDMYWGKRIQTYASPWSTDVATMGVSGTGQFLGGGLAILATPNVLVELDYRHHWLPDAAAMAKHSVDTFMLRGSYKFN